ncbi:MAG: hypothetical protein DMG21_16210, partial [Acidobacteria bacterium]
KFKNPAFLELSIGCENCHGPGALHVKERRSVAPLHCNLDTSIVNPTKIPGWLADNICMYCHQGLDARALLPGKSYADFRPGTPLADTLAIFVMPIRRGEPPGDPLLEHFVPKSLRQCFLQSGGRLTCITCHDPHYQPAAREAPAYFRSKCLTCHTEKSCTVPIAARLAKAPPNDCAGCHMPKQTVAQISHSSLTDHRILARPGEPLPEIAYHMTTPEFPGLVFLDAIPQAAPTPVPPLTLFRAYAQLVQLDSDYAPGFDSELDSLAKSGNQDPAVLGMMGLKAMNAGTPDSLRAAAQFFVLSIQAGSNNPQNFELLATIQAQAGQTQDAVTTLQQGLKSSPYSPRLYRLLAALYVAVNAHEDALKTMKKDLELFPEDSYMRSQLKRTENPGGSPGAIPPAPK